MENQVAGTALNRLFTMFLLGVIQHPHKKIMMFKNILSTVKSEIIINKTKGNVIEMDTMIINIKIDTKDADTMIHNRSPNINSLETNV